jgi:hypothetical protein
MKAPAFPVWVLALAHLAMFFLYAGNRDAGTDAAWTGFPLDDAWIHLVYARSLAEGGGFAYNPGQWEAGFTSPLWALSLAPLYWLTGFSDAAVVAAVKILGTALSFASSLLAFRVAALLSGSRAAGWAASLMLALDPALGFARVSGMEVPLVVAASLWTLLALVERKPVRAGLGLACCGLARPELALFGLLALPLLLSQLRAASWKARLAALAPAPLAAAAWMLHNVVATGRPLPSTYYVKGELARAGLGAGSDLGVLARMFLDTPWFAWGLGVPLFGLGAWTLLRARRPETLALLGTALLLPLAIAFGTVLVEPGAFYWLRYVLPALPFVYVIVGLAAGEARSWLRAGQRARAAAGALLFAAGAATLPAKLAASAELYSWNAQNINEVQVTIGRWIASSIPASESIALNDAGAIRYFGGLRATDMVGLNDHEVAKEGFGPVVMRRRPRYYALFPSWYPGVESDPTMRPVFVARSPRYTICDCAQEVMVVFERTYAP